MSQLDDLLDAADADRGGMNAPTGVDTTGWAAAEGDKAAGLRAAVEALPGAPVCLSVPVADMLATVEDVRIPDSYRQFADMVGGAGGDALAGSGLVADVTNLSDAGGQAAEVLEGVLLPAYLASLSEEMVGTPLDEAVAETARRLDGIALDLAGGNDGEEQGSLGEVAASGAHESENETPAAEGENPDVEATETATAPLPNAVGAAAAPPPPVAQPAGAETQLTAGGMPPTAMPAAAPMPAAAAANSQPGFSPLNALFPGAGTQTPPTPSTSPTVGAPSTPSTPVTSPTTTTPKGDRIPLSEVQRMVDRAKQDILNERQSSIRPKPATPTTRPSSNTINPGSSASSSPSPTPTRAGGQSGGTTPTMSEADKKGRVVSGVGITPAQVSGTGPQTGLTGTTASNGGGGGAGGGGMRGGMPMMPMGMMGRAGAAGAGGSPGGGKGSSGEFPTATSGLIATDPLVNGMWAQVHAVRGGVIFADNPSAPDELTGKQKATAAGASRWG